MTMSKVTVSVSQQFIALNTFVKYEQILTNSIIERILRIVSLMTTMKEVVIFCLFGAIDATVLVITSKQIELEGCACAQIEALGERNGLINPDNA